MLGKADTPANEGKQEGVQWETTGDKTVGKANTPSNKGSQEGVQCEAQGDKTLRKADAPSRYNGQWETKGNKKEGVQWETSGDKLPGRRTHQPTKGNNKGYNGRQKETRSWGRWAHHSTPRRPP